jgi:small-conductance mechanosensitive channel
MFNQIFSKKVIVPFFQFVGIIAIFTFIVFPGLTAADTLVNIFSLIIGFFTLLALYYFVKSWFVIDEATKENEPGETELDYIPKPKVKRKPKVTKSEFPIEPHTKTVKKSVTKKTK